MTVKIDDILHDTRTDTLSIFFTGDAAELAQIEAATNANFNEDPVYPPFQAKIKPGIALLSSREPDRLKISLEKVSTHFPQAWGALQVETPAFQALTWYFLNFLRNNDNDFNHKLKSLVIHYPMLELESKPIKDHMYSLKNTITPAININVADSRLAPEIAVALLLLFKYDAMKKIDGSNSVLCVDSLSSVTDFKSMITDYSNEDHITDYDKSGFVTTMGCFKEPKPTAAQCIKISLIGKKQFQLSEGNQALLASNAIATEVEKDFGVRNPKQTLHTIP